MNKFLTILLLFDFTTSIAQMNAVIEIDTLVTDSSYVINRSITYYENDIAIEWSDNINIFYKNGVLQSSYITRNGQLYGAVKDYYENGMLKEEYYAIKGRKVGIYVSYYSNGKQKIIGRYKDIECLSEIEFRNDTIVVVDPLTTFNNLLVVTYLIDIKIGKWFYYDIDGRLIKEEDF